MQFPFVHFANNKVRLLLETITCIGKVVMNINCLKAFPMPEAKLTTFINFYSYIAPTLFNKLPDIIK